MFWTPAWSKTSTIMDVAKLTRFSRWRLTAGPDEVNLFVGRPFPVYRLNMRITLLYSHIYLYHETACIGSYIATEDNWV